jgi:hypothetical protein
MSLSKLSNAFSKLIQIINENSKKENKDCLFVLANIWAFLKLFNEVLASKVVNINDKEVRSKLKDWTKDLESEVKIWKNVALRDASAAKNQKASSDATKLISLIEYESLVLAKAIRGQKREIKGDVPLSLSKLSAKKSKWIKS